MADTHCKHCGFYVDERDDILINVAKDLELILEDSQPLKRNEILLGNQMENMIGDIRRLVRKIRCIQDGKHIPGKLLKQKPSTKEK